MRQFLDLSKLLILTNSLDGSSDIIVKLCEEMGLQVFRFNVDLYLNYEISVNQMEFTISDPVGRTIDIINDNFKTLWRKPHLDSLTLSTDAKIVPVVKGMVNAVLVSVLENCKHELFINPQKEKQITKLNQLRVAGDYFNVPKFQFSIQGIDLKCDAVVAKPLGEMSTIDGDIFYTTLVQEESLERPFPWFLQQAIIGGKDVTGVYIDGKTWFFASSFQRSNVEIDWRTEINTVLEPRWAPWVRGESTELQLAVHNLMSKWGLRYGRLDFIEDENGKLWFLECNVNGQFGWLDGEDLVLHRAFLASALR